LLSFPLKNVLKEILGLFLEICLIVLAFGGFLIDELYDERVHVLLGPDGFQRLYL
jgi:hypothetical protein